MTQLATYTPNSAGNGTVSVSALVWDRILDALDDNDVAWEGEERSVKEEHAELLDELESLGHYLSAHGCGKSDTLPETTIRVLVAIEGGNVSSAVADRPGVHVTVIDYDCEGADADAVYSIPQTGGGTADAWRCSVEAEHDPAFIAAAQGAALADPDEALEFLRDRAAFWEKAPTTDLALRLAKQQRDRAAVIEAQLASEGLTDAAPDPLRHAEPTA